MTVRTLPRDPPGEGGPITKLKIFLSTSRITVVLTIGKMREPETGTRKGEGLVTLSVQDSGAPHLRPWVLRRKMAVSTPQIDDFRADFLK